MCRLISRLTETELTRSISVASVCADVMNRERAKRCEEILTIQAMGLKKRLAHTHAKCAVVGISGGLDSTLALLVTAKAFDAAWIRQKAHYFCDYAMFWNHRPYL